MQNRLRALFIGCGAAGGDALRAFLAGCDVGLAGVGECSKASSEQLKLPLETPVFADLDKALESVKADVAFIASPNVYHAPQFLACAKRGLHVFLEKPVALLLSDALEMQRAAEKHRIKVFT